MAVTKRPRDQDPENVVHSFALHSHRLGEGSFLSSTWPEIERLGKGHSPGLGSTGTSSVLDDTDEKPTLILLPSPYVQGA